MKRLVLASLLIPFVLEAKEHPEVGVFLSTIQLESSEQHDRIERALEGLLDLHEDDLEVIAAFIWTSLARDGVEDDVCACEQCCEECAQIWDLEKD